MKKIVFYALMFQFLAQSVIASANTKKVQVRSSHAESGVNNLERQINNRATQLERYLNNQLQEKTGVLAKKKVSEEALIAARDLASAAVENLRQASKAISNGLRDSLATPAPDTQMVQ